MHQTYVEDIDGALFFIYNWESTTEDLRDLVNCSIREKVDYPGGNPYYWPSPPWSEATNNPTIRGGPATSGEGYDFHWPGNIPGPYCDASFTSTQVYEYHCGPDCCMNPDEWCPLLEIGPIIRMVSQSGTLWRYSIIKSGAYAEIFPLP